MFLVLPLNHETVRAKSFTGVVGAISSLPLSSLVFTFLADDSSVNRAGGTNSC